MTEVPRPTSPGGREVRVGLVGYGLAGSLFHAPLIRSTRGMRLTTVVTSDPERTARCRADNPGVEVVKRPADLWDRAAAHDLVVVATPTGSHLALGLEAVAHGLALVVDKPLAASAPDGRQLVEAAARARTFLSVFHNRRWDSDTLTIQRLLGEGTLGTVTRFESRFERWRPQARAGAWREEAPPSAGGGVVLDLGSHVVDQALHLFGPAVRVYGEIGARRRGSVEDDAFIAISHRSGVTSHLWVSAVAALPGPRVRMLGLSGAYMQPRLDGQEDALRVGRVPGEAGWGREPRAHWGRLATETTEAPLEPVPGNWPAYYQGVVAALLGERRDAPVSGASALAVLDVIDAARVSADSGVLVDLA